MAKFTVYFKDKVIKSYIFDSGVIHVGRDESNDLIIENLAVAPAHAVIVIKMDNCIIKQLNDEYPLIINNEQNKEALLQDNDKITIGKHSIVFNTMESVAPTSSSSVFINNSENQDVSSLNDKLEEKVIIPDANLQILDGQHIGRVLPLKKAMTRFGHSGSGVVVISKRKDGYFISSLEGSAKMTINQEPLDDKTIQLNNNDIVVIDNISMQFFLEK